MARQMLERQQVKKELTFAEICPRWATVPVSRWYMHKSTVNGRRINIGDPKRCVVGEAHHFPKYDTIVGLKYATPDGDSCDQCDSFSSDFCAGYEHELLATQARFVQHWNEVHVR